MLVSQTKKRPKNLCWLQIITMPQYLRAVWNLLIIYGVKRSSNLPQTSKIKKIA